MNELRRNPKVFFSFYEYGDHFRAISEEGTIQNPVYTILGACANSVVDTSQLQWPEQLSREKADELHSDSAVIDRLVYVEPDEAIALANLGEQLLALNEAGQIEPPLDSGFFKEDVIGIRHLIASVEQRTN